MPVADSEEDGCPDERQRSDDDDPLQACEKEDQRSWPQESYPDYYGVLTQPLRRLSTDAVRGVSDSVVHPCHRAPNGVT
jgi:hypothetical protein